MRAKNVPLLKYDFTVHTPEILRAVSTSRDNHHKLKVSSWSFCIFSINAVNRTYSLRISFGDILDKFSIQSPSNISPKEKLLNNNNDYYHYNRNK